jgi:hypothetical protein
LQAFSIFLSRPYRDVAFWIAREAATTSEPSSGRASVTAPYAMHARHGRCSPDLSPLRGFPVASVGPRSPPLTHFDRSSFDHETQLDAEPSGLCLRVSFQTYLAATPKSNSSPHGVFHLIRAFDVPRPYFRTSSVRPKCQRRDGGNTRLSTYSDRPVCSAARFRCRTTGRPQPKRVEDAVVRVSPSERSPCCGSLSLSPARRAPLMWFAWASKALFCVEPYWLALPLCCCAYRIGDGHQL